MKFCYKLEQFVASVMADLRHPAAVDKTEIESAIYAYYRLINVKKPRILWLPNPWLLWFAPVFISPVNGSRAWKRLYVAETLERFECRFQQVLSKQGIDDSDIGEFWSRFPVQRLDNISLVVEQVLVDVHNHADPRNNGEVDNLTNRFCELTNGYSELRVDFDSRVDQLNWYQIQQYFPNELIWENIFNRRFTGDDVAMPLPPGRTFGPRPRGIEWGSDLRLQILLYEYARRYCGISFAEEQELDLLLQLLSPLNALAFFEGLCLVCEPPLMLFDEQNRLHSSSGPAISYALGFDVFAYHGQRVAARAILATPDLETIMSEPDAEVVSVLIQRYGTERYISDSGIEKFQEDECGALYRMYGNSGTASVFLMVRNATPEPCGQFKNYFLRVPPEMHTAKEAVSWTFRLRSSDYGPAKET
ncbi:MAG: hypothetical protein K2X93_09725 [Candidatus Obscuribacterales bacterium]|nr:hypothetical protein [Candidatus Obscuribacterales bacterium]